MKPDETQKNPAGSLRVLDGGKGEACAAAAEALEALAAEARAGRITSFHGITMKPGGSYTVHSSGGLSRLQSAGALMDAMIHTLGYAIRGD